MLYYTVLYYNSQVLQINSILYFTIILNAI